jgi:ribosomal protein S18 acetylase RimI-like enzyme
MVPERQLHYLCQPTSAAPVPEGVFVQSLPEFLRDEPACRLLWQLIDSQFKTRSKFLAIWPSVRFIITHRDPDQSVNGFILISAPVNWQIDYVVVRPEARGKGAAAAMLRAAVTTAAAQNVPYIMLTSKESLRPLYESVGFRVVGDPA